MLTMSILTREKKGFGTFRGEEPWQCPVLKGELVTEIPQYEIRPIESGKPAPNYRLYHCENNAVVVLYAKKVDVSPVEDKEVDYLLAVEPPTVRLKEYLKPDETKMKMELVCDDVVLFRMKLCNGPDTFVKGIIRYLGPLEEKEGIFFGIEILVGPDSLCCIIVHEWTLYIVSFILIQSLIVPRVNICTLDSTTIIILIYLGADVSW